MTLKSLKRLKEDFLHEFDFVTNVGLKLFVYPFFDRTKISVYCFNIIYFLVILTSIQLFISLCITKFQDWFQIVNIAPNLGVCLMILIKYKKIHTQNHVYQSVLVHFKHELWDIVADTDDHRVILSKYTKTTHLILRFEYYWSNVLTIVVCLFPRLIMLYESAILNNEPQFLYPFDGWYPFDKVKWYYVAYIWEGFMTTVVISIFGFANMIHLLFTRSICMELKLLGNMMEGLINTEDITKIKYWKTRDETFVLIRKKLITIICRHQLLEKLTTDLDKVFGDGMLLTYVFGTVFICLTIFTATVVDNFYLCIRYFSFFCSLLLEVFIQCVMGQTLIYHSSKLERAIYFADWTHANAEIKKMLLIFLIRAQKPFKFSANGFVIMDLNTFCSSCSLSYQFFNLLHTAYSK